jgi:hypothetical protein
VQLVIDNVKRQDHTQTFGEYCLSILTPEYREVVTTANLDWLVMQYVRFSRSDTFKADVVSTAILEHADSLSVEDQADFRHRVDTY